MTLPNALIKVINSKSEIVKFEISRIVGCLKYAILDTENCREWIAQERAELYAYKIEKILYEQFYDIKWNFDKLFSLFNSFNEKERKRRIESLLVTERIVFLIFLKYESVFKKDSKNNEKIVKDILRKYSDKQENLKMISDIIIEKLKKISGYKLDDKHKYPSTVFIMDSIENYLKNIGEIDVAESLMIYREGKNKIKRNEISETQFTNNGIHWPVFRDSLEWSVMNDCENIFSLNEWILNKNNKDINKLVKISEKRYREQVQNAVNLIIKNISDVRVIIIAGPSCSNKTTTTVIINEELKKLGFQLKQLNVDDYYKNVSEQPKDEFGDYDFEMPESIDVKLLSKNLKDLLAGKTANKPIFNFKKECRDGYEKFKLKKNEILLIDCLHGLHTSVTGVIANSQKFRIYIESMNVFRNYDGQYTRWTDIRLLKRMVRDKQYRSYSVEKTLAHWPYVRKGELKHIVPYIYSTDIVINSGLAYELSVLKTVLKDSFPGTDFIENLKNTGRFDAYIRALRIKSMLDTVEEFPDLDLIPDTSPIREFIGGSSYIIPHNE